MLAVSTAGSGAIGAAIEARQRATEAIASTAIETMALFMTLPPVNACAQMDYMPVPRRRVVELSNIGKGQGVVTA